MTVNRPSLFGVSNPFAIILSATVIALVIGFGLRTFFASPELRDTVTESLKSSIPDADTDLGQIQLVLSNGLFPTIALSVSEFSLNWQQGCMQGSELKGLNLVVPLRLTAMLFGPPKWGHVRSELVQLRLSDQSRACMASRPSRAKSPIIPANYQHQSSTRRKLDLSPVLKASGAITGIAIKRLLIDFQSKQLAELNDVDFNVGTQAFELDLVANVDRSITYNERLPPIKIQLSYSQNQIDLQMDGRWREGIIGIETLYDVEHDILDLDLAFKHIPVAPVSSVLKRLGHLEQEFLSNSLWVTCVMSVRAVPEELAKNPWKLHKCEVVGEAVELAMEGISYTPKTRRFDPFQIKVTKLDILEVMKAIGQSHPSTSLGRLGRLEGELVVSAADQMQFEGKWKGLELIFSNRGFRQVQLIEELQVQLKQDIRKVQLHASEFQVDDGVSQGEFTADYDLDTSTAEVNISFDQLMLSPKVQNLMLSGQAEPMAFRGILSVANEELDKAELELSVPRVEGDEIDLSQGIFIVSHSGEGWTVGTTIQALKFSEETEAHQILRQIFPESQEQLEINQLIGDLKMTGNQMQWQRLDGRIGPYQLTSRGGWREGGELFGQVNLDSASGRLSMNLKGDRANPEFKR